MASARHNSLYALCYLHLFLGPLEPWPEKTCSWGSVLAEENVLKAAGEEIFWVENLINSLRVTIIGRWAD